MLLLPSASEPEDPDLDCGLPIDQDSSTSDRPCTDMDYFSLGIRRPSYGKHYGRSRAESLYDLAYKGYNHFKNNTAELEDKQNHIFSHDCQSSRIIDNNTSAVFCFLSFRL
jgi:hypothetical protein